MILVVDLREFYALSRLTPDFYFIAPRRFRDPDLASLGPTVAHRAVERFGPGRKWSARGGAAHDFQGKNLIREILKQWRQLGSQASARGAEAFKHIYNSYDLT